ncbi:kinase-like protein [Lophiostoma macrostomum CBS 122681]|uniref:Kinase-like protein n=1 Tax=Lophiostoma macrostomum CBS 122681 TaxID=1314788 RepID=A0A6A6TJD5_9PLEO|nr:kinase-like protein [Lophiostoma macrostomum CBS 122681]
MQSLRSEIKALRHQVDGDSRYFVPHQSLSKLFSYEKVSSALEAYRVVPRERLDSLVVRILSGALRVFAILVVLGGNEKEILRFVEHDNFQGLPIDHRLPFSSSDLKQLIPNIWDDFYEKQWEFSAPVFLRDTEHRFLDDFTILPFVRDQKIAAGGFGEVFRIRLHPDHQQASWLGHDSTLELVRKEFNGNFDNSRSHQQELLNFTVLSHVKHPHIQQLLASYTHKNKHNFLFPLARGGDMEVLFRSHERPAELTKNCACYVALARLSSALEAMHDFKHLNLELIGLHRDIKPSNILVNRGGFILTDFGLSKFKTTSETSRTPFQIGGGDCLPPECEDLHTFRKGAVGRSGDIWSLGCVILELLVYMQYGPSGVSTFREERVFKAVWKMRTFHGPGKEVNPYVLDLMERTRRFCSLPTQQLLDLVRDMLLIEPSARPKAKEVTARLQFVSLHELLMTLEGSYTEMVRITKSLQVCLEFERLRSWMYVTSFVDADQNHAQPGRGLSSTVFEEALALLYESHEEVGRVSEKFAATGRVLCHDLRKINDALFELLPTTTRSRASAYLDLRLLDSDDLSSMASIEAPDVDPSITKRLGTLAYAKKFSEQISAKYDALLGEQESHFTFKMKLEAKEIQIEKHFEEHELGWIVSEGEGSKTRVLVEWIRYDLHWDRNEEEMIQRVATIATSLHEMKSRVESLRILRCSHYFRSATDHAFGLVYDLPSGLEQEPPQSLHSIITATRKAGSDQISLEDRFSLASALATTLLDFHKATLVHKSISSHNIIFGSRGSPTLRDPYLIGFNYARPLQPKAFSTGPPPSRNALMYHHPDYRAQSVHNDQPFQMVFDYYSLGLVLLEIGIWDTVVSLKAKSQKELRKKVLGTWVPVLKHCMGTAYHDAVQACLRGGIAKDEPGESMRTILEFQRLVVEALHKHPFPTRAI